MHIQLQYVTAYYELTSKKQHYNSYAQVSACDLHSLPPSLATSSTLVVCCVGLSAAATNELAANMGIV